MNFLKKIGKWSLFFISGYFGTNIVLAITLFIPIFAFLWIHNWSLFWFVIVGSILISVFYYVTFGLLTLYFTLINKVKPDYWVSNIFLLIVAILSLIAFAEQFSELGKTLFELFDFKAILFLVAITPTYLYILFMLFIAIFLSKEDSLSD